ncbi:FtsK/SpoIIIE domain-containing protein [Plantactinospora sp. KLBMP9567]|uniref:FtsK/SpoIIIE domain-containing protein n=1 Tax=Plantactinospora sp. KLBMP9567 TaxID=3085900 RepID=UPI0029819302|nr:FtsK/SpoIIIE domain-containing protein [Plantactinospora sp. KLBMP9567]MDW5323159.1 FtsK/SpoIIIE domain-containing protein [Plantactinospora sp. KLBMP9567]
MGLAATFGRAVAAHRQARAHLDAARHGLAQLQPPADSGETADVVARLRRVGEAVSGEPEPARFFAGPLPVRLGVASTVDGSFPAVVPLSGGTHLAIDADARDGRVAALLRTLVVRLLAAAPAGSVRVSALDSAAIGATFLPLRVLVEAGAVSPPATTDAEIAAALDAAERHARAAQQATSGTPELLLLVAASMPAGRELGRLAALTHAGPTAGVCVIAAGYPSRTVGVAPPPLGGTTHVRLDPQGYAWIGDPPGHPFSSDGTGLAAPVRLDGEPPAGAVGALADRLGEVYRRESSFTFTDLLPARPWPESSGNGLRAVVGRTGREQVICAFDDQTPHWLVGGRTGAGKTVFLLDVLYGLAARYSPDELSLYLLDFKEGVSFTEFVPTGRDPSWIPHARAVGIESDREYGVAVLRELRRELNRRASALKRHGVTKLADLPRDGRPVPRIVAVIDEFHVLFAGNDAVAREAVSLLEELARKGRSYGIHLVLASQSMTGIEALYGKTDSIFGQFPLRVALPGGGGVLDTLNDAAGALPIGSAIVNPSAGLAAANTVVQFPDAHASAAEVAQLRHELWQARKPGSRPPAVFKGYESAHVEDDPTYRGLVPGGRRPLALVGRTVDVDLTSALFPLDATPGRHLAVVGTSPVGASVLHAATVSLARQHTPGSARFLVAPLVAVADEIAEETIAELTGAGHPVDRLDAAGLRDELRKLAVQPADGPPARTFLVGYGMDGASGVLGVRDENYKSGLDDLQAVLRQGPAYGVHLLGWWRGLRRLSDDIGGSSNRDDVACLVALNVPGSELSMYLGLHDLAYTPRANRALLVDRHDQRVRLIVPFVRAGYEHDDEGS